MACQGVGPICGYEVLAHDAHATAKKIGVKQHRFDYGIPFLPVDIIVTSFMESGTSLGNNSSMPGLQRSPASLSQHPEKSQAVLLLARPSRMWIAPSFALDILQMAR